MVSLAPEHYASYSTSTSYDKAGELTSATLSGTTTSYSYNADGERLSEVEGGSTIASGTWNGAAQLTSYNDPAGNMSAASYDGNGLRATATSGTGSQSFVWNDVSSIPQVIMDTGNAYIYTDGLAPAEQVNLATGVISYLVADSLGSVRGVVSSSGALTVTTSYDAWGNPETAGGLSASTPFGYAGGYTDPTGLIYLINRYYDPATGQLISVDPQLAQTQQPYAYADGNPVTNIDPTGLCANTADAICPGQTAAATRAAAAHETQYDRNNSKVTKYVAKHAKPKIYVPKHGREHFGCFLHWGTGWCHVSFNEVETRAVIGTLTSIAEGEASAGELLAWLPDAIGAVLDLSAEGSGWLAERTDMVDEIGHHHGVRWHIKLYTCITVAVSRR